MDNPAFLELPEAYVIEDKEGKMWLPVSELPDWVRRDRRQFEIIRIARDYYDVVGYSIKRRSLWIKPIIIEGSADHIDKELAAYLDKLQ